MRIGIYARVSTKDQSCELQLRDLRAYCAARGFEAIREYVDAGQSGAKDSRPELNKLMDDARKRQFERDLIRERVSAGIRNARANGKKLGRPKRTVDGAAILKFKAEGNSLRQIAAKLGVGYGTVRERLLTSHKL